MKKLPLLLVLSILTCSISAQQLFFEAFSGMNRTAYDSEYFSSQDWYAPIGLRIAGGAERFQIGGEYHRSLGQATFNYEDDSRSEFKSSYYGGFLRANLGRYPAFGFGVILRVGAGMYTAEQAIFESSNDSESFVTYEYDPHLGFNGGIGFSIPLADAFHFDIGYTYNYVERPELDKTLPSYTAHFHSIQAGFSLNLVFGDAARRNKRLKSNWKWRRGWRGKAGSTQ